MDKNKRGFTLIELLAVIIILAIIALIAVPVIMNVIKNARKSALEDSAYGVIEAAELYYSNKLLEPEGMTEDQEFTVVDGVFKNEKGDTLEISGSIPSNGKVTITKEGKIALAISNGEYYVQKATSENKVGAKLLKEDNILETELDYKKTVNPIFTISDENATIPTCITDNITCSDKAIKEGIKVGVQVNDSETKNFYVINDENNKLTLIMDSNIDSTTVAWYAASDNSKGPLTALDYLESQTAEWTNIPGETYSLSDTYNSEPKYTGITRTGAKARLLTMTEASNLGCTSKQYSCPTWLYGNLGFSEAPYGYWISSAYAANSLYAWRVNSGGLANGINVDNTSYFGVRPVITISKTIM